MARPISKGEGTAFGKFLKDRGMTYEEAAAGLDVTRSYAGMLARGDVSPALALAFRISDWARRLGGDVPVESWRGIAA